MHLAYLNFKRSTLIQQMSQFLFRNLNPEYVEWRKDIKYKTQVGLCVAEGFRKRGYTRPEKQQGWNIYWVQKENLQNFYSNHRITREQKLNHYRTFYEICRKDNLNRNLKKYKRGLEREGKTKQAAEYNFAPLTFHIPIEYPGFCEEFKRIASSSKPNIWIMKPTAKSQGKGIFLFNKLSAFEEWLQNNESEAYICQKYIQNPLLIGHKKFDLRLYVLCTSYRPLTAYLYREGFARFTHSRYDDSNITATEIHLTNVAIQKHTSEYSQTLGGKWMLSHLKKYLLSKHGYEAVNSSFYQIKNLVIKTLRSVSKLMSNEQNCFQLYGFDVMLDDTLKPWLIEVNGSPSMRANTKKDRELKVGVIDDMLSVIDLEKIMTGNEETFGGFDLICRNDMNFEFQYFSGLKACMLGCKLERQKCYRGLANTLNSYYKSNNKFSNKVVNPQNDFNRQYDSEVSTPSPNKKSFSVRRQKQSGMVKAQQEIKKDNIIMVSMGGKNEKIEKSTDELSIPRSTLVYNLNPDQFLKLNNVSVESIENRTTYRKNSNLIRMQEQDTTKYQSVGLFNSQDFKQKIVSNK